MHKLTNWTARRSGPRMVVHGTDENGQSTKVQAIEVRGPNPGMVLAPSSTVAIDPDGNSIELVGPALTEDDKVKRIGNAVTKLETELIDKGQLRESQALIAGFAALPPASMATLYDILVTA